MDDDQRALWAAQSALLQWLLGRAFEVDKEAADQRLAALQESAEQFERDNRPMEAAIARIASTLMLEARTPVAAALTKH